MAMFTRQASWQTSLTALTPFPQPATVLWFHGTIKALEDCKLGFDRTLYSWSQGDINMKTSFARALLAVCCLSTMLLAATVKYRFSNPGNYPGAVSTTPLADNLTEVGGFYEPPSGNNFGYLENHNKLGRERFLSIQPAGSEDSWISGINSHNVAVGGYCMLPQPCDFPQGQHGFTFDHGKYTTIDYSPVARTAVASSVLFGINDLGQMVGGYCNTSSVCPALAQSAANGGFLYDRGQFRALRYPGAQFTEAYAINNAGQIVGTYDTMNNGPHSYLYQNGAFTNIDFPQSATTSASAINNKGVVAGFYALSDGSVHGFLRYKDGTFVTVDHPNTGSTGIFGINDDSVIVGIWLPPIGQAPFKGIPIR
jgi:probable HAF family extracellular repeat protein